MGDRGFGRFLGIRVGGIKLEHSIDMIAEKQLEIVVGSDLVTRINVDGLCVLRVKVASSETDVRIVTPVELIVLDGDLIMK